MKILRSLLWLQRMSVFSGLKFLDAMMHCAGMATELQGLMRAPRSPLDVVFYIRNLLCFQLDISVLSAHFGIRQSWHARLNTSRIDHLYHRGMLYYYLIRTVFHGMITVYEMKVEQYASAFGHFKHCLTCGLFNVIHELILTSLILHTQLRSRGVNVTNIPDRPDGITTVSSSSSSVAPSSWGGYELMGTTTTTTATMSSSAVSLEESNDIFTSEEYKEAEDSGRAFLRPIAI